MDFIPYSDLYINIKWGIKGMGVKIRGKGNGVRQEKEMKDLP